MAITFYPKAGCVLMCDFSGYVAPEMVKTRPIIVVSPNHLRRAGLHTVVPMSTTEPDNVQPYHLKIKNPLTHIGGEVWVKCDMPATVRTERLDRIKLDRGVYRTYGISEKELEAIRDCLRYALGIK